MVKELTVSTRTAHRPVPQPPASALPAPVRSLPRAAAPALPLPVPVLALARAAV
jgi:hypothetical protein